MAKPNETAMREMRRLITREDEEWWRSVCEEHPWREASTYRKSAPHTYVVRDRGMIAPTDILRAFMVVRTFGQPEKFWSATNVQWTDAERGMRYFVGYGPIHEFGIINRADTSLVYGKQDAPVTETGYDVMYDGIATNWWVEYRPDAEDVGFLNSVVSSHVDDPGTTVLDLGAGQGGTFGSGAFPAGLATVVDNSRAMLNHLVLDHPKVLRVVPADMNDEQVWEGLGTYETVIASFGSASYLTEMSVREAVNAANGTVILMTYAEGTTPRHADFPGWVEPPHTMSAKRIMEMYPQGLWLSDGAGRYDTVVIKK